MGQLEDMISRADAIISDPFNLEEQNRFIGDFILGYQKQAQELTNASIDLHALDPKVKDIDSVKSIRTLLVTLKEKRDYDLEVARANAGAFNLSASSASEATAVVTVDITLHAVISQVYALPDDILDSKDRENLVTMLKDLDSSRTKESKFKKTLKTLGDWLFSQGIKAIPTIMPYIAQTVKEVLGI